MKQGIFLLIVLSMFISCSLIKEGGGEKTIPLSNEQLDKVVHESVSDLLKELWVSDFLLQHNERPILMTSSFTNPTKAMVNIQELYGKVEMNLIESGQVRVVKSNQLQRNTPPTILAAGKSVNYVLSATFEKKTETKPPVLVFHLSLWNENSPTPITTISKEID